jgi:uncharacterized protein YneF (UPF0154 family)
MQEFWKSLLTFVLGGGVGAALGWYFTRKAIQKQLKENPPVNEKMIREMMRQMGRTPSEKQVRAVMRSMDEANGTSLADNKKKNKKK